MSHISRSCANAPGWPEEKSGGLRYNDWRVLEVLRVGECTVNPTVRWGKNLGGGRKAGSREPVSYTCPLGPRICGWGMVWGKIRRVMGQNLTCFVGCLNLLMTLLL